MKETKIDEDRYIKDLTNRRVKELLEIDATIVKPEEFDIRLQQAKIGMIYVRDREIMKRVNSGQMIRVITLITQDPATRKDYITAAMPEFKALPIKQ